MDPTVDPTIKSFIPVAADSHFPLQNLPFGMFSPTPQDEPRAGTRIGDHVLDLAVIQNAGLLAAAGLPEGIFGHYVLNPFMELPVAQRRAVRLLLHGLLRADEPTLRDDQVLLGRALLPVGSVVMQFPVGIPDFTGFTGSREHATNVGAMLGGREDALPANWLHLPAGCHGRASSIILSGQDVVRPSGQMLSPNGEKPVFGPCKLMDFALEMGFFIGTSNQQGHPVSVDNAEDNIFGLILVNDWSARDIQDWESQPLGPFTARNFATSISPWIVTLEALAPFRCASSEQDPIPLPYLQESSGGTYDINLAVEIQAEQDTEGLPVTRSNFRYLYWTMAQQLAQHTVTGCNLSTGDLLASGTISGPDRSSLGSMLEISRHGTEPVTLPGGSGRKFLHDGDTVTMTAWCQGEGYRVGFGEVTGKVLPAIGSHRSDRL